MSPQIVDRQSVPHSGPWALCPVCCNVLRTPLVVPEKTLEPGKLGPVHLFPTRHPPGRSWEGDFDIQYSRRFYLFIYSPAEEWVFLATLWEQLPRGPC